MLGHQGLILGRQVFIPSKKLLVDRTGQVSHHRNHLAFLMLIVILLRGRVVGVF
jgi:hypothetical protein